MENNTKYVRIGDVAKLYGISKQTLIHYDRIGLLTSSTRANNKYRYYSFEDLDKLEMILSLKSTGLKLKEIESYMKNPSVPASIELLNAQQKSLELQIKQMARIKEQITSKIDELNYIENMRLYSTPTIIEKEERYIISETIDSNNDKTISASIQRLKEYIESSEIHGRYLHFFEGFMVSKNDLLTANLDQICKTFIFINKEQQNERSEIIPAGKFLMYYHFGSYEKTSNSYKEMLAFIKKNNLVITGSSLENPVVNAWSTKSIDDYVTEIQIPISTK
jgi:DNA-binding transcriptional MerR regulator